MHEEREREIERLLNVYETQAIPPTQRELYSKRNTHTCAIIIASVNKCDVEGKIYITTTTATDTRKGIEWLRVHYGDMF